MQVWSFLLGVLAVSLGEAMNILSRTMAQDNIFDLSLSLSDSLSLQHIYTYMRAWMHGCMGECVGE